MTLTSLDSKTDPFVQNSKCKDFSVSLALLLHSQLHKFINTHMQNIVSLDERKRARIESLGKGLRHETYLFMWLMDWRRV
jgi:hypothetical protein